MGGGCFLGFWGHLEFGLVSFYGAGGGEILTLWVKGVCNVLSLFWGFAVLFWEGKGLVFGTL